MCCCAEGRCDVEQCEKYLVHCKRLGVWIVIETITLGPIVNLIYYSADKANHLEENYGYMIAFLVFKLMINLMYVGVILLTLDDINEDVKTKCCSLGWLKRSWKNSGRIIFNLHTGFDLIKLLLILCVVIFLIIVDFNVFNWCFLQ